MSEESKIEDILVATTGLVEAVPIYQDLLQPAAKEIGKGLETVAKTINIALSPVKAMVWGYEKIEDFLSTRVAELLKNTPPENIISPKLNVVGPAIEALRYSGQENILSDLYAKLIASSMDKETAYKAHPAFVEILKQLTPDEAKIVGLFNYSKPFPLLDVRGEFINQGRHLANEGVTVLTNFSVIGKEAGVEFLDLIPVYINNLCRLGLAEVPKDVVSSEIEPYNVLESDPLVQTKKYQIENESSPPLRCVFIRKELKVTDLGKQFAEVCSSNEDERFNRDILDNFRKLAAEHPAAYLPHVAIMLSKLGYVILTDTSRRKEVEYLYQEALRIQRKLSEQFTVYLPNVALELKNLGIAHIYWHEHETALEYLLEAKDIIKPIINQNPKRIGDLQTAILALIEMANNKVNFA
jgi:hypothetical protein